MPSKRIVGTSPAIEKRTLRSVESRPAFTATGSDAGAYDATFGTSSPSSVSAISDSRVFANGLVRPVIDSGEPSMRACNEGVTKMSVSAASVAMNGMPIAQRSITWRVFSSRSSKSMRPFSSRIFDTEKRAGPVEGVGDGFENLAIRSEKLKRSAS